MQNTTYSMLVNAAGQLMQQHAFDHLSDDKLSRIRQSFQRLSNEKASTQEKLKHGNELLSLCGEADLFNDMATPQALQQWFAVVNCFGLEQEQKVVCRQEEMD
ncbi:MAG: hypothetical protein J0I09_12325 [Sphingobacteriia bacterium]|nr:hypothetical protein [Sphingobacteriia bacterium]